MSYPLIEIIYSFLVCKHLFVYEKNFNVNSPVGIVYGLLTVAWFFLSSSRYNCMSASATSKAVCPCKDQDGMNRDIYTAGIDTIPKLISGF